MLIKNTIRTLDQRRQIQRNFSDAPIQVDIRQSILDLRSIYKEMSNKEFSKWYQKRYGINAEKVLKVITADAVN